MTARRRAPRLVRSSQSQTILSASSPSRGALPRASATKPAAVTAANGDPGWVLVDLISAPSPTADRLERLGSGGARLTCVVEAEAINRPGVTNYVSGILTPGQMPCRRSRALTGPSGIRRWHNVLGTTMNRDGGRHPERRKLPLDLFGRENLRRL